MLTHDAVCAAKHCRRGKTSLSRTRSLFPNRQCSDGCPENSAVTSPPSRVYRIGRNELSFRAIAPSQPTVQQYGRSEERTSELQSLMRNSYAVRFLTKNYSSSSMPDSAQRKRTLSKKNTLLH